MDPKVRLVLDYISLGSTLFGASWFQWIIKAISNRELEFDLTDEQLADVLKNLEEKHVWLTEDSVPFIRPESNQTE